MHPSRFAGALVLAGATLLFGCEQTAKKDAANVNQPVEAASTQGAGSTTQSTPAPAEAQTAAPSTAATVSGMDRNYIYRRHFSLSPN